MLSAKEGKAARRFHSSKWVRRVRTVGVVRSLGGSWKLADSRTHQQLLACARFERDAQDVVAHLADFRTVNTRRPSQRPAGRQGT